jgi:hypothetical protein
VTATDTIAVEMAGTTRIVRILRNGDPLPPKSHLFKAIAARMGVSAGPVRQDPDLTVTFTVRRTTHGEI